ncbi:hypothetical protein MMC22_004691 [Lobaria immixta]|nr:hypothetical protein [Lobaria immixta]
MAQTLPATLARYIYRTPSRHPFTTGPVLKRGQSLHKSSPDIRNAKKKSQDDGSGDALDPLDLSALKDSIAQQLDWLKQQIADSRQGGRSTGAIEELRVSLRGGGAQTVNLGELAQVVPRGRVLAVMVGDKEHLKPILSALNNSPHSLAPTASATNPLELHVALPPPTRESRSAVVDVVAKHGEQATAAISFARLAHKKKLRRLELSKSVRPDVLHKAGEEMEKVVGKGMAEVKRLIEGVRKGS